MGNSADLCFESASATHAGKVRRENEDACLDRSEVGLWAVADGMGGHHAGQFASRTLIGALAGIEAQDSAAQLLARCEASVVEANHQLWTRAVHESTTIGTTLALLLIHGAHYACIWSGDSRIYRIRQGLIAMLSRDHTEVQDLVERGILTLEESRASPRRNVITRAIGVAPHAELDIVQGTLADGDIFLLCSDGLTNHVGEHEFAAFISGQSCQEACHALLGLALARGGADNVTLVVVRYRAGATAPALCARDDDRSTIVLGL